MIDVRRNNSTYKAKLTLSDDPDSNAVTVTLTHEYGNVIVNAAAATRESAGVYTYTFSKANLKSAGVHKIHWAYEEGAVDYTQDDYINVFEPYITSSEFFDAHSELEDDFGDSFDDLERKVRKVIDTYCGQSFSPKFAKTLTLDGNDNRSIWLPERMTSFTEFLLVETTNSGTSTSDYTTYVELAPGTNGWALRWKANGSKFTSDAYFTLTGDWGWPYVPPNVSLAADLILQDWMNDDSTYRKHGIVEVYMNDNRFRFDNAILGSTGNIDADVLLMDFTLFLMTMV